MKVPSVLLRLSGGPQRDIGAAGLLPIRRLMPVEVPHEICVQPSHVVDCGPRTVSEALFDRDDHVVEQFEIAPRPNGKQRGPRDESFGVMHRELLIEVRHRLKAYLQVVLSLLLLFLDRPVVFDGRIPAVGLAVIVEVMELVHPIPHAGVFVLEAERGFDTEFPPGDLILLVRRPQYRTQGDDGDELKHTDPDERNMGGEVSKHAQIYLDQGPKTN